MSGVLPQRRCGRSLVWANRLVCAVVLAAVHSVRAPDVAAAILPACTGAFPRLAVGPWRRSGVAWVSVLAGLLRRANATTTPELDRETVLDQLDNGARVSIMYTPKKEWAIERVTPGMFADGALPAKFDMLYATVKDPLDKVRPWGVVADATNGQLLSSQSSFRLLGRIIERQFVSSHSLDNKNYPEVPSDGGHLMRATHKLDPDAFRYAIAVN